MKLWNKFVIILTGKIAFVLLIVGMGLYSLYYSILVGSFVLAIAGIVISLIAGVFYWDIFFVNLFVSTSDFPSKATRKINQIQKDISSLEEVAFFPKDGTDEDLIEKMTLFTRIKTNLASLKDDINC